MTSYVFLPEPHSMSLGALIAEIEKGGIKIPQFQRDFVWSKEKSAELLDSVLKGYPIGTFILWKTKEELRAVRNIGGWELPKPKKGEYSLYILDGQQRLTSLFAAVRGGTFARDDCEIEDFTKFYVDLEGDPDTPLVVAEKEEEAGEHRYILLSDLLFGKLKTLAKYPEEAQDIIQHHKERLNSYQFATIEMKEAPIEVATEVFSRLNVNGKPLSLFEIMVAKTYDAELEFDLGEKYRELMTELGTAQYDTLPSSTILQAVTACITKETRKKAVLGIRKSEFVSTWNPAADAIKRAVDFLRMSVGVPVSELLPYPALIVPFTYFFFRARRAPDAGTTARLQDFFWRVGLGERYSRSLDSHLAQDVKLMDAIVRGKMPTYDFAPPISPDHIFENGYFAAGRAFIKTLLCLMASSRPLSFRDNSVVNINNDWLSRSNSRNYHHFFPKAFLTKKGYDYRGSNHIANITLVDDQLNKQEIRDKPPSKYVAHFEGANPGLKKALASHFIGLNGFGIESDDYDLFLRKRCAKLSKALQARLIS